MRLLFVLVILMVACWLVESTPQPIFFIKKAFKHRVRCPRGTKLRSGRCLKHGDVPCGNWKGCPARPPRVRIACPGGTRLRAGRCLRPGDVPCGNWSGCPARPSRGNGGCIPGTSTTRGCDFCRCRNNGRFKCRRQSSCRRDPLHDW